MHVKIEKLERGQSGRAGIKSIPLDQAASRITKPLKIPGGFIDRGDVVSIPRTRGGRSNGLVVDIQGTKAKVEWIDQEGQRFFKWVDVSEADQRIDMNPPTQPTRTQRASHIGQNSNRPGLARRAVKGLGKMVSGTAGIVLAAGTLIHGIATTGDVEAATGDALGQALLEVETTASDLPNSTEMTEKLDKLLDQMDQTIVYFEDNDMTMLPEQKRQLLEMLNRSRDSLAEESLSYNIKENLDQKITGIQNRLVVLNTTPDNSNSQTQTTGSRRSSGHR